MVSKRNISPLMSVSGITFVLILHVLSLQLIEIVGSEIMIVTSVSSYAPYVYLTYRTATGYTAYKDRPINNVTPGIKLYGFNVNTTGY